MSDTSPRGFINNLWWVQLLMAGFTGLVVAAAIAFGGNPLWVVGGTMVAAAVIAVTFQQLHLIPAMLAFVMLTAFVTAASGGAAIGFWGTGPVIAALALFGSLAVANATTTLHDETGIPWQLCFFVALPIGRIIGIASALWVLSNPTDPTVAMLSQASVIGLRALAIGALAVPIVIMEVIKYLLRPIYVAQAKRLGA